MKNLIIDGNQFDSVLSLYDYILSIFPEKREYFGRNLDALYDILSEEAYQSIRVIAYQKIRFELGDEFFIALREILFDLDVSQGIYFDV
ncbi:barstar family protein [Candidatus Gracilibacteria bacterium]|nr:barstar family protein [Candidatus Gracilibacteria bacterium]